MYEQRRGGPARPPVGAMVLKYRPLASPQADQARSAVLDGLRREFSVLHSTPAAQSLRGRPAGVLAVAQSSIRPHP
ncbi:hypothetical protein [Streptomyces sp. NPDC060035]|uniref:hypothetical protein n=1 Tax=Streptomyces sp. NPDC060035 TaxID=3347044 RepID=UPI0036B05225